ncbi:MAG: hypothetical protein K1X83_01095 [Oligoflexia bacterium]|nr:hypothetical protein [Oligoflexia bacterium]
MFLAAAFLVVLAFLCLLVFGVAYIATSQTRLKNIANLAGVAALQDYMKSLDGAYNDRLAAARDRANFIAGANHIPGIQAKLGEIGFDGESDEIAKGGRLTFGKWYETAQSCAAHDRNYAPCFVPNPPFPAPDTFNDTANAVRLDLRTQVDNPLIYPFMSLIGEGANINATIYARAVERCAVMLLDVSMSSTSETHRVNLYSNYLVTDQPTNIPKLLYKKNYTPSMMAYKSVYLDNAGHIGAGDLSIASCMTPGPWSVDKFVACNMLYSDGAPPTFMLNRPITQLVDPTAHYWNDYTAMPVPIDFGGTPAGQNDWVMIDSLVADGYRGPQPFTRFLESMNSAVRYMDLQDLEQDRISAVVFAGDIRDRYPQPSGGQPFAREFGELLQLTNPDNRGTHGKAGPAQVVSPAVHPNFVDRAWFPYFKSAGSVSTASVPSYNLSESNLVAALETALSIFATPGACPDTAQRIIVLESAGVPSCFRNVDGSYTCSNQYSAFQNVEQQLLLADDSLSKRLRDAGIMFSYVLDSSSLNPNFIDIWQDINGNHAVDQGEFLDASGARYLGYDGYCQGKSFFDCQSRTPDGVSSDAEEKAYEFIGDPGFVFGRVNGLLGKMALETGGIVCPIADRCTAGMCGGSDCYIDHDGDPATPRVLDVRFRADGATRRCSVYDLDKTEQAKLCMLEALKQNPFALAEEGQ